MGYPARYYNLMQLQDDESTPEEHIQYSLFPRINPDPEVCEPNEIILRTQAVSHPKFIPFENRVYLGYGKELVDALEKLRRDSEEKPSFRSDRPNMARIIAIRKKYFEISDRATRLAYLQKFLQESHHVISE
jgi:hypothetical protein